MGEIMADSSHINVDLTQMILTIETAVSLVGMNDTHHGKRVGFIAMQIGQSLGLCDADTQYLFELGLLHDCGVSTESMHNNLVNHFDWEEADIHCRIGYQLLQSFQPLARFATPILYHHTPWPSLQNEDVSLYDARMANIIFLADRIDVLGAQHYEDDILLERDNIVASIRACASEYFLDEFVEAFCRVQASEAFWITLESRHIARYTWDMGKRVSSQSLSIDEIKHLSKILSYIVDQKSPFTAEHSIRVSDVATYIAKAYGLSPIQCDKVEIAGLLHDLGKLHVPDKVLDKPGPLDEYERAVMNQHSYETYEILRHIDGLEEIARLAAFHHEGLNGEGYPFHPERNAISTEARIIAVADIFQALVQDRPYRSGLPITTVISILRERVDKGQLDPQVVNLVERIAEPCYVIAQGRDPQYNQPPLKIVI